MPTTAMSPATAKFLPNNWVRTNGNFLIADCVLRLATKPVPFNSWRPSTRFTKGPELTRGPTNETQAKSIKVFPTSYVLALARLRALRSADRVRQARPQRQPLPTAEEY